MTEPMSAYAYGNLTGVYDERAAMLREACERIPRGYLVQILDHVTTPADQCAMCEYWVRAIQAEFSRLQNEAAINKT